jgi:hypothetical protein
MSAFEIGSIERHIGAIGMWISGDEVARIQDGRGLLLSVQYGTVWITQAGSTKDVFIGAGGSFLIDRDGCALVSLGGSEPAAAITLMPSIRVRPTIAQRLATGLRRRSNAMASIVVLARDIRVEVFSGGLPARLRPVGFNRDRYNHAA